MTIARPEFRPELNTGAVYDHLAGVFEIHVDLVTDLRLHLSEPPIGLEGMAYEVSGLEEFVHDRPSIRGVEGVGLEGVGIEGTGVEGMSAPELATGNAPELAALVSARLCHDLISPIGAIGNGLELLRMTEGTGRNAGGGPELALISDSLGTALARLRFYRIAFGPADERARQSVDEARQITDALYAGRFGVTWIDGEATTMSRTAAQIAFLAILCFERSLPMGGDVVVSLADDRVQLRAEECRVNAPAELWLHVTSGAPVPEPRPDNVQFQLLRRALTARGYHAERRFSANTADLSLIGPGLARAIPA